jgi:hypothetical protein
MLHHNGFRGEPCQLKSIMCEISRLFLRHRNEAHGVTVKYKMACGNE